MEIASTMMKEERKYTPIVWKNYNRSLGALLGLILVALVFHYWSSEAFLTSRNLSNLSRQICVNLTLAVGMTLIILTSGIDLSVGSVLALSGMVSALTQVTLQFSQMGATGAALSFLSAILMGGLCGAFTGFSIARMKITPFIVTLGMMVVCRGLTLIISGAQAVAPLGESLSALSSDYLAPSSSFVLLALSLAATLGFYGSALLKGKVQPEVALKNSFTVLLMTGLGIFVFCGYRGIPYMVLISLCIAGLGIFVLKYTRYGRFLYAIGGNREAAELSGVPVTKTLWTTYLIMGVLSGLAGVMDSARVNGSVPSAGELAELDAIAAVVIGGTSLMGGVGTITGTVFGVLVMGILNNGMSLVGISEHYQKVFKGVVIILAVYLDLRSKKK